MPGKAKGLYYPHLVRIVSDAIRLQRISRQELAHDIGINPTRMGQVLQERAGISLPVHDRLVHWLADHGIEYRGEVSAAAAPPPMPPPPPEGRLAPVKLSLLPVLTKAYCSARNWTPTMVDAITLANWDGPTVSIVGDGKGKFAFWAEGESMIPTVPPSAIVVVDSYKQFREAIGQVVIVVGEDESGNELMMVKRLKSTGEPFVFTCDNPACQPVELPAKRIKFIWPAVQVTSMLPPSGVRVPV